MTTTETPAAPSPAAGQKFAAQLRAIADWAETVEPVSEMHIHWNSFSRTAAVDVVTDTIARSEEIAGSIDLDDIGEWTNDSNPLASRSATGFAGARIDFISRELVPMGSVETRES